MQKCRMEQYNRWNRDRPGGHMFRTYFGHLDSNYNGGAFYKRECRRKQRREHQKITQEALYYHYVDLYDDELEAWYDSYQDLSDELDYIYAMEEEELYYECKYDSDFIDQIRVDLTYDPYDDPYYDFH